MRFFFILIDHVTLALVSNKRPTKSFPVILTLSIIDKRHKKADSKEVKKTKCFFHCLNEKERNINSVILNSLLLLSLFTGNTEILEISSKHMFTALALLSTVIKAVKSANALLTDSWKTLIFSYKSLLSSYVIIQISELSACFLKGSDWSEWLTSRTMSLKLQWPHAVLFFMHIFRKIRLPEMNHDISSWGMVSFFKRNLVLQRTLTNFFSSL